jgi:ABC-2 type transport system permease protein
MTGFMPLVGLRARETVRTWRVWVLPAVFVFFAATGPVITRFTKDILAAALGAGQAGAIPLPDPTASAAYAQWANDLTQIVALVVVVLAASAINGEVRSGVAALILVKPTTRAAYVLSHALVFTAFVALAAHLGALVSWLVTTAVFGPAPLGPVLGATAVWAVLAAVLISAALLASAAFDAFAGAAGAGIGAFFLLALLGAVPQLAEHTPAGLVPLVGAIAAGTQDPDQTLWQPTASGILFAGVLLAAATLVFRRRELQ